MTGTMGLFKYLADDQIENTQLMPNGKVLIYSINGSAWILEADEYGSYENGTVRRTQDMVYTHHGASTTVRNDGKIQVHAGEYGTSAASGLGGLGYTSIFDPVTETWSSPPGSFGTDKGAVGYHAAVMLTDDGRQFSDLLQCPAEGPAIVSIAPFYAGTNYGYNGWTEAHGALLPTGDFCMFLTKASRDNLGESGDKRALIRPGYSSEFQANGSSAYPVGVTYESLDAAFAAATLAAWRLPNDNTRFRFSSVGEVYYEQGATMWMPLVNRVVLLTGLGYICTSDPNVPGSFDRVATMGFEPTHAEGNSASFYLGKVRSSDNGVLPSSKLGGSFTFTAATDFTPVQYASAIASSIEKSVHVRLNNNTKWVRLSATSISGNNQDGTITMSGVSFPEFPGATWDGSTFMTNDEVCAGRPSFESKDAFASILPNGHIIFFAGTMKGAGSWFNDSGRLLKWDGVSSVATPLCPNNFSGSDTFSGMLWELYNTLLLLPDGTVLNGCNGAYRFYFPDSSEKTPMAGASPSVSYFPSTVRTNDIVDLVGTTLNGIHEGSLQGDDAQSRSNFPVVRLTNKQTNRVVFARTFDFTYRGIKPGRESSCKVDMANVPPGEYAMQVIANACPSSPVTVNVLASSSLSINVGQYR